VAILFALLIAMAVIFSVWKSAGEFVLKIQQ
jgi:hypothetical protein